MNKFILSGRLTKKPELKSGSYTSCMVTVASDVSVRRNEKWEKDSVFNTVTVFGKQAENCTKYLEKGQYVVIEGNFKTVKNEEKGTYQTYFSAESVEFGAKATGSSSKEAVNNDVDFDAFEPPF